MSAERQRRKLMPARGVVMNPRSVVRPARSTRTAAAPESLRTPYAPICHEKLPAPMALMEMPPTRSWPLMFCSSGPQESRLAAIRPLTVAGRHSIGMGVMWVTGVSRTPMTRSSAEVRRGGVIQRAMRTWWKEAGLLMLPREPSGLARKRTTYAPGVPSAELGWVKVELMR